MVKKRGMSLRQLIVLAGMLVVLPLTALFLFFNYAAISQVNAQLAAAHRGSLEVFCNAVEEQMRQIDNYMYLLWSDDPSFAAFCAATDRRACELAGGQVLEEGGELMQGNAELAAFILCNPSQDVYLAQYGHRVSYTVAQAGGVERMARRLAGENDERMGWFVHEENGKYFWVSMKRKGDGVFLVLVDLVQTARNAQTEYALASPVVFVQGQQILSTAAWIRGLDLEIPQVTQDYAMVGGERRYMVVRRSIVGLAAYYAVSYQSGIGALAWLRTGPFWLLLALSVTLAVAGFWLQKSFFRPLRDLVDTMRRIGQGDLYARPGGYTSREFTQVNETFNTMIEEISDLRIESYEHRLAAQQAEMDALRMQIHPHFYLNNLKNIYGLAQAGKKEDIQQTILLLSNHLRYSFDLGSPTVPLQAELHMCQNYMDLQVVGDPSKFSLALSVEPDLMGVQVPPVTILTLLENSVKHGTVQERPLKVEITARTLRPDDGPLVYLVLRDNGPGFDPALLDALNKNPDAGAGETQVGLSNVARRFRLFYGERFAIAYSNRSGAQVELFFPIAAEGGRSR